MRSHLTPATELEHIISDILNQNLLTVSQVAEILHVSKMTVYRLINDGELTALRVTKRTLRVREEDLRAHLLKAERSEHD
ncbi:helix-turn-helix domain-containing protein [Streptomyces sp. G-5]|uniref:helix-turn-helix domain-containing protein n=1 Tax=Streptomyces sp. G-5 TaxID=2977231 RepID=UPI0021D1D3EF|nr:helix-turn-helix domain-containing protein [Streptomyces sp. G-5]MCU4750235.1 helix-turn-helix domain-containing protein [Streptomyces sp. G-5]